MAKYIVILESDGIEAVIVDRKYLGDFVGAAWEVANMDPHDIQNTYESIVLVVCADDGKQHPMFHGS